MIQSRSLSVKDFGLTSQLTVAKVFWVVTFALLTAVGARVEIPHSPVPFTLQTFFVLLAGGLLGARKGSLSMALYLALGIVGFPVFSSASFGVLALVGPTGGYLLSFPLAAYVVGAIIGDRRSMLWILAAMTAGLVCIFGLGTLQLWIVTGMPFSGAMAGGFLIFSWWDLLKLAAAGAITHQMLKRSTPR